MCQQSDNVSIICHATSVVVICRRCQQHRRYKSVLLTPVANLPPVSPTTALPVAKFAASVVDTGGKFATSAPSLVNISVNFQKKFKCL